MSIDSCDHCDYIVVYEFTKMHQCPVCEVIREKEEAEQQVVNLQGDVENAEEELASLQNEIG